MQLIKNKFLVNSFWLIIEKLYLLLGGLFVTALVARYLGPSDLGMISYGITLSVFCTVISQWGASYYIFNYATKSPVKAILLCLDSLLFRFFTYIICCFLVAILLYFSVSTSEFFVVFLVCISNVFIAMDIYQFYFNGSLYSKYNAIMSICVKSISMLLRLCLVFLSANIYFFIIPFLVEGFILFYIKHEKIKKEKYKLFNEAGGIENQISDRCKFNNYRKVKYLPYVITGILIVVYSKCIDISLKYILGFSTLGEYSALLAISTAWTFIPLSIGTSLATKAINDNTGNGFSFLYLCLIVISIPILVFIYYFSFDIVNFVFGSEYSTNSKYLFLFCCGAFFSTLGFLQNRYIAARSGQKYLLRKTIFVSLFCLLISPLLIFYFHLLGAIIAYVLVEIFSLTVCNYFFNNKLILKIHFNVFNFKVIKKEFFVFFLP
ncbi:TPA: hypothetical protein ACX6RP_003749 [Photobacterium damselae]